MSKPELALIASYCHNEEKEEKENRTQRRMILAAARGQQKRKSDQADEVYLISDTTDQDDIFEEAKERGIKLLFPKGNPLNDYGNDLIEASAKKIGILRAKELQEYAESNETVETLRKKMIELIEEKYPHMAVRTLRIAKKLRYKKALRRLYYCT